MAAEPASWDGPFFGELGVLACDGKRVQCAVCGRWFEYLAPHVQRTHRLHPDEYKRLFGLNAGTGLLGPALRAKQAQNARNVFGPHWGPDKGHLLTSEERSAYAKGRRWRLQARLNPETREVHRRISKRRYEEGKWQPPASPPPGAAAKGLARFRELLQDPAYRAQFGQNVRERRGARVQTACVICGTTFEAVRFQLARGEKKTCGKACFKEFRRRYIAEHNAYQSSERFRRIAGQLQALEPACWTRLTERDAEIVRLYFGVADGAPLRQREIAERVGLHQPSVHRVLKRALTRLLFDR